MIKQLQTFYLRDDNQNIIIYPTKYGYKIIYQDKLTKDTFKIAEVIGKKNIIV